MLAAKLYDYDPAMNVQLKVEEVKNQLILHAMDGGLGRQNIPEQISTSSDVPKLYDALRDAHFDDAAARAVLGGNWQRFFANAIGPG